VFAVAWIAFWCCCRLGELLVDAKFDPDAHIARSTLITRGMAANCTKYTNFVILRTKTSMEGASIYMSDSTCDCSATSAFEHHLSSNTNIPSSAPLFAFETANRSWAPMKRAWFLDRCNEIWSKEGLTSIKGHGFRIGGMTHLLLLGVDPWVVMAQGRWSSQSFLLYWR